MTSATRQSRDMAHPKARIPVRITPVMALRFLPVCIHICIFPPLVLLSSLPCGIVSLREVPPLDRQSSD